MAAFICIFFAISLIIYCISLATFTNVNDYIKFQKERLIESIRMRRSKQYIDLIKYDIRSVAQKDKVEGCTYFLIATVILIAVIICTLHHN